MHVGHSRLPSKTEPLRLTNVLHVPKLQHNLLSVRQLCQDNNCNVVFDSSSIPVKDNAMGDVLLQASSLGPVDTIPVHAVSSTVPTNVALIESADLWHRRLGHYEVMY